MNIIPDKIRVIVLPDYQSNLVRAILGLKREERPIRKLNENEVLVKMEAAPCNPSDIAFIRGGYNVRKSTPAIPGFEGAGVVVDTGKKATSLLGKRVSSFTQSDTDGTWAEYFISAADDCLILDDNLDFDRAACLSINPFTAFGLLELALQKNCKTIVQNAGGGQIAAYVRALARLHGLNVINIVRKQEQLSLLKSSGEMYVLDSTKENFREEIQILTGELDARIAYDAVGGEQSAQLLNILPFHSDLVIYGGLSGTAISGIDTFDIIFRGKRIYGFNLSDWKKTKTKNELEAINHQVQEWIISEKLKIQIQASYKLEDVIEGIRAYIKSMSAGKILLKP